MGDADRVRRISGNHGVTAYLGSGAPGALLHDLYEGAVAQLVSKGCFHHRGLHFCVGGALYWEFARCAFRPELVDDCWSSSFDHDRSLYRVPFRAGKGPRPLAECVVAATPADSGAVARVGRVDAN